MDAANIVGYDTEHDSDEPMARQMLNDLTTHYPGHDWFIVIKSGIVHVKVMSINPNWGMCLHYSQIKADAKDRKKQLIRSAGEFLERAHLRRGRSENVDVKAVEGIPDKHMTKARML